LADQARAPLHNAVNMPQGIPRAGANDHPIAHRGHLRPRLRIAAHDALDARGLLALRRQDSVLPRMTRENAARQQHERFTTAQRLARRTVFIGAGIIPPEVDPVGVLRPERHANPSPFILHPSSFSLRVPPPAISATASPASRDTGSNWEGS